MGYRSDGIRNHLRNRHPISFEGLRQSLPLQIDVWSMPALVGGMRMLHVHIMISGGLDD